MCGGDGSGARPDAPLALASRTPPVVLLVGSSHPASRHLSDPSQRTPGRRDPTKILLHQGTSPRSLTRSLARSPACLAAYTRSPHALAARARLCSYHSQSAGDGSPQCSGPAYHPAGRPFMPTRPRPFTTCNARGSTRFVNTLHTIHHAGSPLSRPPRSLHPRPSRVREHSRSPQAHAQSARDGAAPLIPVRTPP